MASGTRTAERTLNVEQARAFYDHLGSRQDWQRFFEDPAVGAMVGHGYFNQATSVLEFGCGTGRLAEHLLSHFLPKNCHYVGTDVSVAMVTLARERLRPWANRAFVEVSDGSCMLTVPNGSIDRIVSTYVLDLLSREQINVFLSEALRVLVANGRLCLVSLSYGSGMVGRLLSSMWKQVFALSPRLVGGCRPIDLAKFLSSSLWQIEHIQLIRAWGITSQVVLAAKCAAT